jgi:hypothetical protein
MYYVVDECRMEFCSYLSIDTNGCAMNEEKHGISGRNEQNSPPSLSIRSQNECLIDPLPFAASP